MNFINKIDNIFKLVNKRLSELCGILLFIIMILLVTNVASREVGYAIEGLSNLSVLVLISVVYLGLSTTEQHNQHAAVEILDHWLNKKSRRVLDILVNIIKLVTILIFLYAAFDNLIFSFQSKESFPGVVTIPIWPSKLALVAGLLFFVLQILLNLLKAIIDPNYGDDESDDSSKDLTANL
ncbi:TRAP transporter small permease subunit [Lentibacillus jeotgali]|uniref:TRAP transporter small permease subunit n=1 Tax=Lentibacillus jeotgali TaxID=558169 RepID=UPI00026283E9|nr:TRAP transporter small permease [Lentibacillus jeotgali]